MEDLNPDYFSYNHNGVLKRDSVFAHTRVNNRDMTITALYDGEGDDEYEGETIYAPDKKGIFILDRNSGQLLRFISAWGWYPWQCYPIAIDNLGERLIYRTGGREHDYVRIHNFKEHKSQFIDKIEGRNADNLVMSNIDGAFNIGDNVFALNYSEHTQEDSKYSIKTFPMAGTIYCFS